ILVVSEMLEEHAASIGVSRERITIVRTGVDCDLFRADGSGDSVREMHGLHNKKVIGFVGSLKPWHDLDTLRAAVQLLVASDPSYHLLVVGEGPRFEELQSKGEAFATYTGAIPHE